MVPTSLRASSSFCLKGERKHCKACPTALSYLSESVKDLRGHRQASLPRCPPALVPLAPCSTSVSLFTHPGFSAFPAAPETCSLSSLRPVPAALSGSRLPR